MKVKLVAGTHIDHDALEETGYVLQPYEYSFGEGVAEPDTAPPDELAEAAGRLCYLSWNRPNPKTATNEGYIANILDHGHYSVLEHASVTLYVEGVSRALLLELERHRFLSFSVVSQRYVDHSEAEIVIPPVVRDYPELVEELEFARLEARERYETLVDLLRIKGYDRKTARGAARAVLPEGTETRFFVSANIRAWREVVQKRISPHADAEIREFAQEVLKIVKEYAPNSFQDME